MRAILGERYCDLAGGECSHPRILIATPRKKCQLARSFPQVILGAWRQNDIVGVEFLWNSLLNRGVVERLHNFSACGKPVYGVCEITALFVHFSLAPLASIGDNPALSQQGDARVREVGHRGDGPTGAR